MRRLIMVLFAAGCTEYTVSNKPPTAVVDPGAPQPDIEVTPDALDFGSLALQCESSPQLVTIRNVGGADLDVTSITVDNTAYLLGDTTPRILPPGESFTVDMVFTATSLSSHDGFLTVESNDPDEAVVQVDLAGLGADGGFSSEMFQQTGSTVPTDVLFIIDNSSSMLDDTQALRNNFTSFMQGFLALNLDFQIGVVSTDMQTAGHSGALQGPIITPATPDPIAQFADNTSMPFSQFPEEQGLDAIYAALNAPLIDSTNAGLVRDGSLLSVIVISDEDDQSVVDPSTVTSMLNSYQGDPSLTSMSIVGGPRQGILPCWRGIFPTSPVPTYWEVANATGGIHVNLCQLDMSVIVQQLAVVAAGLDTSFPLSQTPTDPAAMEVLVDGVVVPLNADDGWIYDGSTNSVVFNGTAIPAGGSDIEVRLPIDGACE